jgi:uncharacterized iron-regulated membrane protein
MPMIIGGVVFIGVGIGMAVTASKEKTANGSTTKYKGLMAGAIIFGLMGLGMMGYAFMGGGGSNSNNANTTLPANNIRNAVRGATTKAEVDSIIATQVNAAAAEKGAAIAAKNAANAQVAANAAAAQAAAGKAEANRVAAGLQAKLAGNQASLHALGNAKKGSLDAIAAATASGQAATQA